ncbi:MAG TPA: FHA domain-containing protein [Fimbriimonadaceae bacterium]|nr:FHA domain-containing protein [Fimbriimonadaceae bacterium]
MGQILLTALMGGLGGLAAWGLLEPMAPVSFYDPGWEQWQQWYSFLLGGFIGLALGGTLGWLQGSKTHVFRGMGLGLILGAVGGAIGIQLGGGIAAALFGGSLAEAGMQASDIPARIIFFGIFGALVGAAAGATTRSPRQALLGLIGGAIGGGVGGACFDVLSYATQGLSLAIKEGDEVGIVGRAVTSLVIGGAIGLFLSIIRQAAKAAWVRLSLGRNEGKDWVIDTAQTFIGRDERAHIPLMGDPNVIPMHACIVRQGATYLIADGGSPVGTFLNGQRISQAPLFHGAQIQIGPYVLEFQLRDGAARRAAEQLRGVPAQMAQAPRPQSVQPMPTPQPTQVVAPASTSLVVLSGPLAGQRFPVSTAVEIGREAPGIALSYDAQASRRHAQVRPAAFGLEVVDLGSTNGTFVNDQRVTTATIKPGDIVRIGGTSFRVE